jgi:uncharacterized protein with PIN domain
LVDQMLMRLGRWLRLLGMDVANPGVADDRDLMIKARLENRVLITRDKRLADDCRTKGVECILIRSTSLLGQLNEMAETGVKMELNPLRCTICNGSLRVAVNGAGDRPHHERTWECPVCGKLYWSGSHWRRIEETLEQIRSQRLISQKIGVQDQDFSLKR